MIKVSMNYRLVGVCGDTVDTYTDCFAFSDFAEAKGFLQDKEPSTVTNDMCDSAGLYELLDGWMVETVNNRQKGKRK